MKQVKKFFACLIAAIMAFSVACCADTVILKEADERMRNTYTLVAVDPEAPFADANGNAVDDVAINTAGADALIHFLLSPEGLGMVDDYRLHGEQLFYVLESAPVHACEIPAATEENKSIRLSTTTSVNDSGLLGKLISVFENRYGYDVDILSLGTGKAINAARYGNADLILVHSRAQEEAFVECGFGRIVEGFEAERVSFIYNYFVLCGPSDDPAGAAAAENVTGAFGAIANGKFPFISRGDASGTHDRELTLWPKELGITAEARSFRAYADWYISAGAGMGACLVMAEQVDAYILTDKGTFLNFTANG